MNVFSLALPQTMECQMQYPLFMKSQNHFLRLICPPTRQLTAFFCLYLAILYPSLAIAKTCSEMMIQVDRIIRFYGAERANPRLRPLGLAIEKTEVDEFVEKLYSRQLLAPTEPLTSYSPPYPRNLGVFLFELSVNSPQPYSEGQAAAAEAAFRDALIHVFSRRTMVSSLELTLRASAFLESKNVSHRLVRNGLRNWYIEIIPMANQSVFLNRLAAQVKSYYGSKMVFDFSQMTWPNRALFTPNSDLISGTLTLPLQSLLQPEIINSSVFHEVVHAEKTRVRLERSKYPFLGVLAGKNPGFFLSHSFISDLNGHKLYRSRYSQRASFDEIETHFLQGMFEMLIPGSLYAEDIVSQGYILARQTRIIARNFLNDPTTSTIYFKRVSGFTVAEVHLAGMDSGLIIEIELLQSRGVRDQDNRLLLTQQLSSLMQAVSEKEEKFLIMLHQLNESNARKIETVRDWERRTGRDW